MAVVVAGIIVLLLFVLRLVVRVVVVVVFVVVIVVVIVERLSQSLIVMEVGRSRRRRGSREREWQMKCLQRMQLHRVSSSRAIVPGRSEHG